MSLDERFKKLEGRLRARTRPNGEPLKGYEQNVAVIRAEMDMINARIEKTREHESGE